MRAKAQVWEGEGWIVTVDGAPIGWTLPERVAHEVAAWLNKSGLREIENRIEAKFRTEWESMGR